MAVKPRIGSLRDLSPQVLAELRHYLDPFYLKRPKIDSTDDVGGPWGVRSGNTVSPITQGYVLTAKGDSGTTWLPASTVTTTFADAVTTLGATKSLLGWWRLGDLGPTTWLDSNPYLSHCDLTKVADVTALTPHVSGGLEAAQDDGAVQFMGGTYPSYPHGDYLHTTGSTASTRFNISSSDFSVVCWVNPTVDPSSINIAGILSALGFGTLTAQGWTLYYDRGFIDVNTITFSRQSNGGTEHKVQAVITPGSWSFIVGTYSTSAGLSLYVNGNLISTNSATGGAANGGVALEIGHNVNGYFTGKVDEASVWGAVLTPDDVLSLYTASGTASGSSPIGPAGGVLGGTYPDPTFATTVAGAGLALDATDSILSVDPSTMTRVWMPLADTDGTLVLDADNNLIPTLVWL